MLSKVRYGRQHVVSTSTSQERTDAVFAEIVERHVLVNNQENAPGSGRESF